MEKKERNLQNMLIPVFTIALLVLVLFLSNSYTEKAIKSCVEHGNDPVYCKKELR